MEKVTEKDVKATFYIGWVEHSHRWEPILRDELDSLTSNDVTFSKIKGPFRTVEEARRVAYYMTWKQSARVPKVDDVIHYEVSEKELIPFRVIGSWSTRNVELRLAKRVDAPSKEEWILFGSLEKIQARGSFQVCIDELVELIKYYEQVA